jgi:hypothetical protein
VRGVTTGMAFVRTAIVPAAASRGAEDGMGRGPKAMRA